VLLAGAVLEFGDVKECAVGGGNEVAAGEAILSNGGGVESDGAEREGADHVVGGGGVEELLRRVPALALTVANEESGGGELADVITDLLPSGVEGACGASGGVGGPKVVEDADAEWIEQGGCLLSGVEDGDVGQVEGRVSHGAMVQPDKLICQ
jgi:hypothetical protein